MGLSNRVAFAQMLTETVVARLIQFEIDVSDERQGDLASRDKLKLQGEAPTGCSKRTWHNIGIAGGHLGPEFI